MTATATEAFAASRERLEMVLGWLDGTEAAGLSHAQLEARLDADGLRLLCQLLQDHLDLRAQREQRLEVVDDEGIGHGAVEPGHRRGLTTIVGEVAVTNGASLTRSPPTSQPSPLAGSIQQARTQ